ncbi:MULTISPECIES: PepSY-associated TM helix domain-containing protein [unclassified Microcoleus]|uniref:PepSY-associated TM helix domain-containing protein n=2 Tax=unclassified Microcoleus TaxID=2642155 RepID=UPI002FD326C6
MGFTLMRTVNGFEENFEMNFRKLAFKLHLYLGLVVGIFLAVIALTGSLLVFSPEIERLFNPQLLQVIPQAERIPLEKVLQVVEKAYPQNQALSILLPREAKEVCQVSMQSKSEEVVSVYVNPYSGEIKGARLWKETFTGFIFTLHAELAGGEFGHFVVGICGLVMLGLTFTGLVLWTGWRNLARGFSINWKAHWQRTVFDLHNVSGIVSVAFLILISATGTAIIFYVPVESTLYWLTNEKPQPALTSHPHSSSSRQSLDEILQQVSIVWPEAKTTFISLPLTPEATFKVRKKFPNDPHPNGISTISIDQYSGEILQADSVNSASVANRILNSLYPLHIGSYGGIYLRLVNAIAGLAPIVLFMTGAMMWRQRHLAKFYRNEARQQYEELSPLSQQWPWF